jgi:hypothetical protein
LQADGIISTAGKAGFRGEDMSERDQISQMISSKGSEKDNKPIADFFA